MMKRTKVLVGAAVAALALGGAGTGIALAQGSSPAPSPSQSSSAKPKHHAGLLARVGHGEVTLNGKKHRVVDLQRGQVQAVSPSSITVKSNDGFTATYTVDSSTKVHKGKQSSAIGQVAVGDRVYVVANKSGTVVTAARIADSGPAK